MGERPPLPGPRGPYAMEEGSPNNAVCRACSCFVGQHTTVAAILCAAHLLAKLPFNQERGA